MPRNSETLYATEKGFLFKSLMPWRFDFNCEKTMSMFLNIIYVKSVHTYGEYYLLV